MLRNSLMTLPSNILSFLCILLVEWPVISAFISKLANSKTTKKNTSHMHEIPVTVSFLECLDFEINYLQLLFPNLHSLRPNINNWSSFLFLTSMVILIYKILILKRWRFLYLKLTYLIYSTLCLFLFNNIYI